jgi:8-oxo-dGTP pyrophosphatase MutT (NUDIX family)
VKDPEAAVAIVCMPGPGGSVLLMRRTERQGDSWSGHWSLPGGRRNPEDEDLRATALRELWEECGIRLARESMTAELDPKVARRSKPPYVLVAPFVFEVDAEYPAVVDLHEAAEACWVPLRTLRDPALHRLQCVPGMPASVLFPAVEVRGYPLWGFTYKLITEWLGLGGRENAAEAAFRVANQILEFLLGSGMVLARGWSEPHRASPSDVPIRSAAVVGTIPKDDLSAWLSEPNDAIPAVNAVEVLPGSVRVVGLSFEEYLIRKEDQVPSE